MPASFNVTLFDQAQTATEPSIAQRGIETERSVERVFGIFEVVFSAQQKSAQRVRGRVARGKLQTFFECLLCL